jgi:hypothetical protein
MLLLKRLRTSKYTPIRMNKKGDEEKNALGVE